MRNIVIYPIGTTGACDHAVTLLQRAGYTLLDHPSPEVTHLLLDVPGFQPDGSLRGGGQLEPVLQMLPENVTVLGGSLDHPALKGYAKIDLLQMERYLAANAAITAECALGVAFPRMRTTFADTRILILGWGRIGKCLAQQLRGLGTDCMVAARNPKDLAMLNALGFRAIDMAGLPSVLPSAQLIFNTVPYRILTRAQLSLCPDCLKIELASKPGLEGPDVIQAKGLPGIHAPLSSGKLIADTVIHSLKEEPL